MADGFWAFEMEKLGADEVIGIEVKDSASLDWPGTVDAATSHKDEAVQRGGAFAPGWPLWWVVNLAAYRQVFPAAGWEITRTGPMFWVENGPGFRMQPRAPRPLLGLLRNLSINRLGLLHSWVLARPAGN